MDSVFLYAIVLAGAFAIILFMARRMMILKRENARLRPRIVEVDEMKKDFISHVSHELKAPLASMQETTHLMLERIPGPLTEKQERLLELNLQSGKRLAGMIGNLLDLSRLEAGIVEYEMLNQDIAELVHSVIVELVVQAQDKTLRIRTDIQSEPVIVRCDPNRMVQLFSNLVENALRFSPRNDLVTVHVKSVRSLPERMPQRLKDRFAGPSGSNGYALIGISDSGPGIEDDHKERVFETFHQVKRGKKTLGQSLGLGLAISRSVVEAHQGTIWVEDNPNGGSVFYVLLPRAAVQAESLKQAS